jgi:transposase-like protein
MKADKQVKKRKVGRPRKGDQLKAAQIKVALFNYCGNISEAARELGVDRRSLWYRISQSEVLQQARDEGRERALDIGERVVVKHMEENSLEAAKYYLDRQGKERGYTTKTENTTAPVQLNFQMNVLKLTESLSSELENRVKSINYLESDPID